MIQLVVLFTAAMYHNIYIYIYIFMCACILPVHSSSIVWCRSFDWCLSVTTQIEDVMVVVPFPKTVKTANLSVTAGHCLFDESSKVGDLWEGRSCRS